MIDISLSSREMSSRSVTIIVTLLEQDVLLRDCSTKCLHNNVFCFTDNIYQGIAPTVIILVRVSMSLPFDNKESFKEATQSLRLIIPQVIRILVVCRPSLAPKARRSVKILTVKIRCSISSELFLVDESHETITTEPDIP